METKRKFNKGAYDQCDNQCKLALNKMMTNKGYEIVGDINKENYKLYDLKFKHKVTGKELSFENEQRRVFDAIKNRFPTIHIPIRKKNNKSDYYLVWNSSCTELAMIDTYIIRELAKSKVVNVSCKEGFDGVQKTYKEDFVDVPKSKATFYKLKNGIWKVSK